VNPATGEASLRLGDTVDALIMRAGLGAEVNHHLIQALFEVPIIATTADACPSRWIFLTQPRTEMRESTVVDLASQQVTWHKAGTTIPLPSLGRPGPQWAQPPKGRDGARQLGHRRRRGAPRRRGVVVTMDHVIVIASGGLDSTVLAYWLTAKDFRLTLVSFDYGQRHRVELERAVEIARRLDSAHKIIDLTSLGELLTGSALTDSSVDVPNGHYTDDSMKSTVVPNRNAIMLDVAVSIAIAERADAVAFGAHAGDHTIYPDCRPEFVEQFTRTVEVANDGLLPSGFQVLAPFLTLTKTDIVGMGTMLNVPFARTWSCYRGTNVHCGQCGTCVERREAFQNNNIADPTEYLVGT
jgi:7-cyano-7-deazaguanine synthase